MVQEGLGGSRKVQEGLEVWHGLGGFGRVRKGPKGSRRHQEGREGERLVGSGRVLEDP